MLGARNATAVSRQAGEEATGDELTDLGKCQAQSLGVWLAQRKVAPTHLYSSPLARARQTWALVQQHCAPAAALEIGDEPRLIEMDQGIFSGLTWSQACDRYPALCTALEQSLDWRPVPNAESPHDCRERAKSLVLDWLQRHRQEDCLWVISHGGFLCHLVSEILGCDRSWGCAILPTGVFEFELDLSRWSQAQDNQFNTVLWKIHSFNSAEHLVSPG